MMYAESLAEIFSFSDVKFVPVCDIILLCSPYSEKSIVCLYRLSVLNPLLTLCGNLQCKDSAYY